MPELQEVDFQAELIEDIGRFTHDPLGFCMYAYDWGTGDLEGSTGPYQWQREQFGIIRKHFQDPKTRHQPCRIAVASGNGIGKSALVAMITHWGLSTHEDCKIVITAGTGVQLQTKTQPELSKWFRLAINSHWFDVKAKSITIKDPKHQDTWRADLITWDEKNPDAFSGLHNKRKRIILIFDEASAIAAIIWLRAQKALTDENTEIIWVSLGNPTDNSGSFAECFGVDKYRWHTAQIDARTVEGTNKEELKRDVERYGEDSDYIRYSIRGEFPRAGSLQFIPNDLVESARHFKAVRYDHLPKILSCDVARFGDNETVIGMRQGRKFDILATYRGIDTVQTAERLIEFKVSEDPDAIIIDGDGIGGAVVDHLKARGFRREHGVFEFHGGSAPLDPNMYLNKIAECWGTMREHLKDGAQIPDDPDLARQLTTRNYDIVKGKVQYGSIFLESKEDMKKRGLASPDKGDCYAMTFALKLAPKPKAGPPSRPPTQWS